MKEELVIRDPMIYKLTFVMKEKSFRILYLFNGLRILIKGKREMCLMKG